MSWAILLGAVWGVLLWVQRRRFRESRRIGAMSGALREPGGRGGF